MKNLFFLFFVITMTLTACMEENTYEVNVVKSEGVDQLSGLSKVTAVTLSGDSVQALISEKALLNNHFPFVANMQKNNNDRYGFIGFKDDTNDGMFDVTVVKSMGLDRMWGKNKVLAETKSGDYVECFIDENLLLKNKIPFAAKMAKSEQGRYGFIRN